MTVRMTTVIEIEGPGKSQKKLEYVSYHGGGNPGYNSSVVRGLFLDIAEDADQDVTALFGDLGDRADGVYINKLPTRKEQTRINR